MSDAFLTPAPGAKAAKICGILAILFSLTCVGIPVAIILGIVALVQQAKAKQLAKAAPQTYQPVPATGLVTGIIGLVLPVLMVPFVGIVSAIAVPALLGQRERARETVVQSNLNAVLAQAEATVQAARTKAPEQIPSQDAIIQGLFTDPPLQALKNPITPLAPAFQRGNTGSLGTVMVYPHQEQEGGVTTWSIQVRAAVHRGGQDRILQGEVITHTQEQVQGHREDGWQGVQPSEVGEPAR